MKPPFPEPWAVARFRPDGSYRTLATFPDREAALDVAAEDPKAIVLFRTVRQRPLRQPDDF